MQIGSAKCLLKKNEIYRILLPFSWSISMYNRKTVFKNIEVFSTVMMA